jgi:hypothetical protein
MSNVTDLHVGDKIKPIAASGLTEEEIANLGLGAFVRHSLLTPGSIVCTFSAGDLQISEWELVECADATPTEQRDNEIERLKQRIKELEDTTAHHVTKIGDLMGERQNLRMALAIVNDRLNEESIDREWCDEYVRILDQVNLKIREEAGGCFTLVGSEKEFGVLVTGSSYVNWSKVISVRATSEVEACRLVEQDLDDYLDEAAAAQEKIARDGWGDHEIDAITIYS